MWSWILATACLLGGIDVQVQTLDGESLSGTLQSIDSDGLTLDTADGPRSLAADQVLDVSRPPAAAPAVRALRQYKVLMADGSQLQAAAVATAEQQASITLDEGQTLELAPAAIQSVRVAGATDAEVAQWQEIVDNHTAGDLLVIRKQGALDFVEGIIHDVTTDGVQFEIDEELVPVKWNKIFGYIYHRRASDAAGDAQAQVFLADGSQLATSAIALSDDTLAVTLASGAKIDVPLAALQRLDYSQGKIVYLSDLDWDARESRRTPYLGASLPLDSELDLFSPQRDRAFDGGPLLLGGKACRKGLALHSHTRLVYRLPEGYRRFVATAGIDDRMDARGHVDLRIEGDGAVLFESTLAGSSEPAAIDVDISGVRRLIITVDYGQNQDLSDHLDLCEAKLIK